MDIQESWVIIQSQDHSIPRVFVSWVFYSQGICGEHLYAYFWGEGYMGLDDVVVQIDYIDVRDPRM